MQYVGIRGQSPTTIIHYLYADKSITPGVLFYLHGCFDLCEKGLPFFFTFTSPFAIFLAVDQLSSLYERDFEVARRTRVRC